MAAEGPARARVAVTGSCAVRRASALVTLLIVAGCESSAGSGRSTSQPLVSTSTSAPQATPAPGASEPPGVLPDRARTPGAVTSTDTATVCAPGYSRRVRPPASYTDTLKRSQLAAGYPGTAGLGSAQVEEDHLVMLALGGDPRSPANLWPEPRHVAAADGSDAGAGVKDQFEAYLYVQVCRRHSLTLATAQRDLATDWYAAWIAAGRPTGPVSPG